MQEQCLRICPWCGRKLNIVFRDTEKAAESVKPGQKYTTRGIRNNVLEKDDIWSCGEPMYCEKCGAQIALQSNPTILMKTALFLALIILLVGTSLVFAFRWYACIVISVTAAACLLAVFVAALCRMSFIRKWRSNIRYVSEQAEPDFKVRLSQPADNSRALFPTNIFMVPFQQKNIYVELMSVNGGDAYFRICAAFDPAKQSLQRRTIHLYFEGRSLCSAEITEIL